MTFKRGARVTIDGKLERWTEAAQKNLRFMTGTIEDYRRHSDSDWRVYLVRLDRPVRVNRVSTFKTAWIEEPGISLFDQEWKDDTR